MDMMLIVSLAAALVGFTLIVRRRMEEVLAPFISILMLVLYGLSIFKALPLMHTIAPAAAAVLCVIGILRSLRKPVMQTLGLIFTPGMLCFAAASAFLVWCSRDHVVHATDDIYYWSIQAHSIFAHGGLTDSVQHLAPRFMTYTPGMQLWQWIGLAVLGEWSEPAMYAMLWIFFMAFLAPLTRKITWKRAYWAPLAVVLMICLPTLMNIDAYDMLRVDTALGICMGYALVQAYLLWRDEKAGCWELLCFGLALCTLVLLKQIGVAWAAMAMAFAWLLFKPRNGLKHWHLAIASVVPLMVFASWKAVCDAFNLSGIHVDSASGQLAQILNGTWQKPEWLGQLPRAMWAAVTTDVNGGLPMIGWLVLLAAIIWILSSRTKQQGRVIGWLLGSVVLFVIGYAVILVASILPGSPDSMNDVAFFSALTQRYGCPLPMGLCMLLIAWLLDCPKTGRVQQRVLAATFAVLVLCFARWGSMIEAFDPEVYAEENSDLAYETELSENSWVEELEGEEPGVILYGTEYPPYIVERLQYVVAPHKVVVGSGYDMDEETFLRTLEENRVTHIICMDDMNAVYENAMNFTEDGWFDVWTIYTVSNEDGEWLISY
ncbi:MAG: hypothetical protein IJ354_00295 [Clostridia bacterium]|nr:hypothetical protein [Clostridia bacterium]